MNQQADLTHKFFRRYPQQSLSVRTTVTVLPETAYYLEKGRVRMFALSPETKSKLTIHLFYPGSFFPLFTLLAQSQPGYQFETQSATSLRVAPFRDVEAFLRNHPDELLTLTRRLASGLIGMAQRIELLAFTDVYGRVLAGILYLARHHGEPLGTGGVSVGRITHQEMAELVGATRETTSVVMKRLERSGILKIVHRELTVPDLAALKNEFATRTKQSANQTKRTAQAERDYLLSAWTTEPMV